MESRRSRFVPLAGRGGLKRAAGMLVVAEMNTRGIRFDGKHNAVNNGIVEAVAGWREFLERDKVTMSLYNPRSLLRDVLPLYSKS